MDHEGVEDWQREWREEQQQILAAARIPVYAPEGLAVEVSGWGGGDGEPVDSVGLRHEASDDRWVQVDTERAEDDEFDLEDAQEEAAALLGRGRDVGLLTGTASLPVDGVPVVFAQAVAGDAWAAIGWVGEVRIAVTAHAIGTDDVRLRAVADPVLLLERPDGAYRTARPVREVLDPQRVADVAEGTPIADLATALAAAARPALALLAADQPSASWIGGAPALSAGAAWPEGVHGAMMFVAQLALDELDPAVWTGPSSGRLHIFCDVDPASRSIDRAGACAILHTPAGAALHEQDLPSALHVDNRLRRQPVVARAGLTLPDAGAPVIAALGLHFGGPRRSDSEALWTLVQRVHAEQGWHGRVGQLLGWPVWQNDDHTAHLAGLRGGGALAWSLLLQTAALDVELVVMLPTVDLAAGRFDRAEATVEHD